MSEKTEVYIIVRGVDLTDDAQVTRWQLEGLPIEERWCKGDYTLMRLSGPDDGWFVDDHEDCYKPFDTWRMPIAMMLGWHDDDLDAWYDMDADFYLLAISQAQFKQAAAGNARLTERFDLRCWIAVDFDAT